MVEAGLGLLSAYPVPEEVNFFFGRSPAALLQLDLYAGRRESPEDRAGLFVESIRRHLNTELDYGLDSLPRVEELLTDSLSESTRTGSDAAQSPPVLGSLGGCLGCYVGEVIELSGQRAIPIMTIDDEVLVDSTYIIRELRRRYG